ncbi:MAG: hypothetical protein IJQ53_02675 [Clostridia bacterium]|nr:hypothetical protein [Clostridia bacterium]
MIKTAKRAVSALAALLLAAAFCSCGKEPEPVAETSEYPPQLTAEEAKALIEADKTVTDIYVNGAIVAQKTAKTVPASPSSEYSDYSKLQALVGATYLPEGGTPEFFRQWPGYGAPAISASGGKTMTFYHAGSSFAEYVDTETVSVERTEEADVCVINCKTASGQKVALKCRFSRGRWVLEKGLMRTLPEESDFCTLGFPYSGIGSMKSFSGSILAVELFISDSEFTFDLAAEEKCSENVAAALDYLASRAEEYGGAPEITVKKFFFEHNGKLTVRNYNIDIMFASTVLESVEKTLKDNFDTDRYDNYLVFICLGKDIEVRAQRYEQTTESVIFYPERVIMTPESTSSEITLAVMELLGAYPFDADNGGVYRTELFRQYFPRDILLTGDIGTGTVSPVTAFRCGMTNRLAPVLRAFWYEQQE